MKVGRGDSLGRAVAFEAVEVDMANVDIVGDAKADALEDGAVFVVLIVPLIVWREAGGRRAVWVIGAGGALWRRVSRVTAAHTSRRKLTVWTPFAAAKAELHQDLANLEVCQQGLAACLGSGRRTFCSVLLISF